MRTFLANVGLRDAAARLVVAVSGGPDSLCLLHVLWRLRAAGGPALHVAHLDHGLRGAQSAAEARFVQATAQEWDIAATLAHRDLPALLAATPQNTQAAARAIRYRFLAEVAEAVGAEAVLVAHQADDQAETVLLHLLRGTGLAGLRGMLPVVPWEHWSPLANATCTAPLLRPLLSVSRAAIEAYCQQQGLAPRHDPSNSDPHYTRSRVRTELLPTLAEYNPHVVAALGRLAQVCADDYAYIQAQLAAHWPDLASVQPGAVRFAAAQWATLPISLQRAALRQAANLLTDAHELSYEQVEATRAAALRPVGSQHTVGHGMLLRVEHGSIVVLRPAAGPPVLADSAVPQLDTDERALLVPGCTPVSAGWQATATLGTPNELPAPQGRWSVLLAADALDGPLLLRRRRAGDRFRPAGGSGQRRLQDFLIDQKFPQSLRAALPIVATPHSIVWVAGLRADARFVPQAATRQVLLLALSRLGECDPAFRLSYQSYQT